MQSSQAHVGCSSPQDTEVVTGPCGSAGLHGLPLPCREVEVAIVGMGFSGIAAAIRLQEVTTINNNNTIEKNTKKGWCTGVRVIVH